MKSNKVPYLYACALAFCLILTSCHKNSTAVKYTESEQPQDTIEEVQVTYKYGLPIDSFEIKTGHIKKNQFVGPLFSQLGAPRAAVVALSQLPDSVFNVKGIRPGKRYEALYLPGDTTHTLHYFIYHNNLVDYTILNLEGETLSARNGSLPTHTEQKVGKAVITSSLWNATVHAGLNPQLALDLSDIYAWTIDFFSIQKGDAFVVYYDQQYLDTIPVGQKKIHAVCFHHYDNDYYAFAFDNGKKGYTQYFDESGKSLKKAFLKAPLKFSRISSHFTYRRYHPVHHTYRAHTGVDYAAPRGTPVHSIGDGIVTAKGYMGGGGNEIKIKHNSIYTTAYLHLNRFEKGLHVGSHVSQGQTIGYVGSTGASTGPHLDFRVWKSGKPVDPLKVKSPPVEPVDSTHITEFNQIKASYLPYLVLPKDSADTKTQDVEIAPETPSTNAITDPSATTERQKADLEKTMSPKTVTEKEISQTQEAA